MAKGHDGKVLLQLDIVLCFSLFFLSFRFINWERGCNQQGLFLVVSLL